MAASKTVIQALKEKLKFACDENAQDEEMRTPRFPSTAPCEAPHVAVGGSLDLEDLLCTIGHKDDIDLLSASDPVALGMFRISVDSQPKISATHEFV